MIPHPGLLASDAEKRYHDGIVRFARGDVAGSLAAFEACLTTRQDVPSAHLFAYTCGQNMAMEATQRIGHLEAIVQGNVPMPDELQAHFVPIGLLNLSLRVPITETVSAVVPFDGVGAALQLAEEYQRAARLEEAIGVVHQLHELRPDDQVVRLSLADLLLADADAEGVLEAASTARNDSDVGVALLQYRAAGQLLMGHRDGAIATLTEALAKTADRDPDLLKAVRYDRALALTEDGKASRARADLERIYAQDPTYEDVSQRLDRGLSQTATADTAPAATASPFPAEGSSGPLSPAALAPAAPANPVYVPPVSARATPAGWPGWGWVTFYLVLWIVGVAFSISQGYTGDLFWLAVIWAVILGVVTRVLGLRPQRR